MEQAPINICRHIYRQFLVNEGGREGGERRQETADLWWEIARGGCGPLRARGAGGA